MKLIRFARIATPFGLLLAAAQDVFAQVSVPSTAPVTGGSTGSSLPNAGTTGLTYLLFAVGLMFFVFGML